MENGTFQNLNLSHLNFEPEENPRETQEILAFPNTSPQTFQALLGQNEDLVARLRASLQKQAHLEQENHESQRQYSQLKGQISSLSDQLLIWREKEKIWKEKEAGYEGIVQEKTKKLELDNDILRQRLKQTEIAEEDLERYKKYHEKVKTSVRPYIQRLKSYAKSLLEQSQSLNSELLQKDLELSQARDLIYNLKTETEKKSEQLEYQKNQLIDLFEEERQALRKEIKSLNEQVEIFTEKSRALERSLERQDELENLVVALRRSKEDLLAQNTRELESLKSGFNQMQVTLKTTQLENENLQNLLNKTKQELEEKESARSQTLEQLTSLRYQWNLKSQECERLTLAQRSLEKINYDLSQRLKEQRLT